MKKKHKHGPLDEMLSYVIDKARLHDVAAIDPLVWYPAREVNYPGVEEDDSVWAIFICASHDTPQGSEFHCDQALLGTVLDDLPEWTAAVDTVLLLKRPGDLTREEAEGHRSQVVRELKKHFADVRPFGDELSVCASARGRWPGKKVEAMVANLAAERARNT